MRLAIVLALACALAGTLRAQGPVHLETARLAPGLFRISGGESGSVMVLTGADGTLLVDARDSAAFALDSAVARVAVSPVRWIVYTHYHWDHIGRAPHWPDAERIAQANLWPQAAKDTVIEELRWTRHAAPPAARPTRTVTDSLVLRLDGEEVLLWHADSAHTDGDLVVFFRQARVVHTGDILEREAYPFIDLWAGGTMDGMIRGMDGILARTGDGWTYAPGHGTVTDRAGASAYREMLNEIRARVGLMVAGGSTLAQIADAGVTASWDGVNGVRAGRRFVQIVALGMRDRRLP